VKNVSRSFEQIEVKDGSYYQELDPIEITHKKRSKSPKNEKVTYY